MGSRTSIPERGDGTEQVCVLLADLVRSLGPSSTFPSKRTCAYISPPFRRHDDHLRVVHRDTKYDFHRPDPLAPTYDTQFTYHLWESVAYDRYLSPYDPDRIHNRGKKHGKEREEDGASDESTFSREARKFVSNEFRIAWRAAKERGDVER